ncbi:MAG: hypothetical protein LBD19_01705 [Endomicrobium sp.]|jgi:hypothetical protein|nr:hypothetical protein [Endomicrobium sp.]
MEKKKLIKILISHMSKPMAYQCLNGYRHPNYNVILLLKQKGIPFEAWQDIKSFITDNDTKSKKIMKE